MSERGGAPQASGGELSPLDRPIRQVKPPRARGGGLPSLVALALGNLLLAQCFAHRFDAKSSAGSPDAILATLGNLGQFGVRLAGLSDPADTSARFSAEEKRALVRHVEERAEVERAAAALHCKALVLLGSERLDEAVSLLEYAEARDPRNTRIRSDLDAAILIRGLKTDDGYELVRALDRIGLSPRSLESLYQRAAALDALALRAEASRAWRVYLELDPDSAWAAKARLRLARLENATRQADEDAAETRSVGIVAPPDSDRPEILVEWYERHGLIQWADAVRDGNHGLRRRVERDLRSSAERIAGLGSEGGPRDETEALVGLDSSRALAVAEGIRWWLAGSAALERFELETARSELDRARRSIDEHDPMRLAWIDLGLAEIDLHQRNYLRAGTNASRLEATAARNGHAGQEARAAWIQANIGFATFDLDLARSAGERSLAAHIRMGSAIGKASANLLLARVLDELGEHREAWRTRLRGFRDLAALGDRRRHALAVGNAAWALAREGFGRAAVDFDSEQLSYDQSRGDPLGLTESHWARASHLASAGRPGDALSELLEAERWAAKIPDAAPRERLLAGIRGVRGSLLVESEPVAATRLFDEALDYLRGGGYEYGQAEILIDRARALRHLKREDESINDLRKAEVLVSRQRSRIGNDLQRISFQDLQARLADAVVAAGADRPDGAEVALRAADSFRFLTLRESIRRNSDESRLGAPRIQATWRHLTRAEALVAYWTLSDELLIWVQRRDEPTILLRLPAHRTELTSELERLEELVARGETFSALRPLVGRISETLIAPIREAIAGRERLLIVPDRTTRSVPWNLLLERPGGEPLVRGRSLLVLPAVAEIRQRQTGRFSPFSARVMVVADPKNESLELRGLGSLRSAADEAQAIRGFFPSAELLIRSDATVAKTAASLRSANIAHFASHFLVGADERARLVLAGTTEEGTVLESSAISRLELSQLRLAVLSGCASQREGRPSLEGTFDLAGAFLAAGADDVVASLWPVDDRTTARLMEHFYGKLARGERVEDALRAAQEALLAAGGEAGAPRDWAGFQVLSLRGGAEEGGAKEEGA